MLIPARQHGAGEAAFEAILAIDPDSRAADPPFPQLQPRQGRYFARPILALRAQANRPSASSTSSTLARCLLRADNRKRRARARQRPRAGAAARQRVVPGTPSARLLDRLDEEGAGDRTVRPGDRDGGGKRLPVLSTGRGAKQFGLLAGAERDLRHCLQLAPAPPQVALGPGRAARAGRRQPRAALGSSAAAALSAALPGGNAGDGEVQGKLDDSVDTTSLSGARARPSAAAAAAGSPDGQETGRRHRRLAARVSRGVSRSPPDAHGDRSTSLVIGMTGPAVRLLGKCCTAFESAPPRGAAAFRALMAQAIGRDSIRRLRRRGLRKRCASVVSAALGASLPRGGGATGGQAACCARAGR